MIIKIIKNSLFCLSDTLPAQYCRYVTLLALACSWVYKLQNGSLLLKWAKSQNAIYRLLLALKETGGKSHIFICTSKLEL